MQGGRKYTQACVEPFFVTDDPQCIRESSRWETFPSVK